MRIILLALLLAPLAAAAPGHEGPTPVEGVMAIHFQPDGAIALHPSTPTGDFLGEEQLDCEPQRWQAGFTRSLSTWQPELARAADIKDSVELTWYVQSSIPGTDEPTEWRTPLKWTAQLRGESDPTAWEDGPLLAQYEGSVAPVELSDGLYALSSRLSWVGEPVLPTSGFQLELALAADLPCGAMPGLRAISQDGARPSLEWLVYDPVRVDLLEAGMFGDDLLVTFHASSPWGRDYLVIPAPTVTGSDGQPHDVSLLSEETGLNALQTWTWTPPANGTYRLAAVVNAADGSAQSADQVVFKIGGEPRFEVVEPAVEKESPGLPLLMVLVVLAIALTTKNKP